MDEDPTECMMIVSVLPNAATFLPEITLTIPSDDMSQWVTVPLQAADAARLGGYLMQTAMGVNRLYQEMEPKDLEAREEIMALYDQFQADSSPE